VSDHEHVEDDPTPGGPTGLTTGDERVDEVLTLLEDLEDRALAEHVALFESAHDRLRSALSDAGQTPS
jgi:hypothetical protein